MSPLERKGRKGGRRNENKTGLGPRTFDKGKGRATVRRTGPSQRLKRGEEQKKLLVCTKVSTLPER